MTTPIFLDPVLRRPEQLLAKIQTMKSNPLYSEFLDIAQVAEICLGSSSTNDYLEKVGAESIGAVHRPEKLGADGTLNGKGVEVKPFKKSPGCKSVAVINDDTPMKLLKSHKEEQWLVLLCANKTGTQILYAVCAPYHYWENSRYKEIVKRLKLTPETGWTWASGLPSDPSERLRCMEELVQKHQSHMYVRSSPISLDVLSEIPKGDVSFWVHPELETKKLHPILKPFVTHLAQSFASQSL